MKKALLTLTFFVAITTGSSAQYANVTTIAGNGTQDHSGDGGPATAAVTNFPSGIAIDHTGNIYFSELTNGVVRKIADDGTISTVAGMVGSFGFSGDGGLATAARLKYPQGLAVDVTGNLYIADRDNNRIRKVDISTGIITTVVGNGTEGDAGDGGLAVNAELGSAQYMAVDASGNIYISDWMNDKIRKVAAGTGIITTIAGTGTYGFSGDGGSALSAQLRSPAGIVLDSAGNIYFSDRLNHRVRKIAIDGIITTVAGKGGFQAFSGDGGMAANAELYGPQGITIDNDGNLYIVDSDNHRLRKVTTDGIINTLAGTGDTGYNKGGFNGDNQIGSATKLNQPSDVVIDAPGNVIFTDYKNQRVRKLAVTPLSTDDFSKTGILIFPNPSTNNDRITIRSQEIISSITVLNSIGQIVKHTKPNNTNYSLDMSHVSPGLYYVKLSTVNNNLAVQKLIVN